MLRRVLLATVMVAASTVMAVPTANAGQGKAEQCPTGNGTYTGVKVPLSDVPVTISVTDTTTTDPTDVVVTFKDNGTTFTLTSPGSDTFTSASWCVKSSTDTTAPLYGTETTGSTSSSNKKERPRKIGYVMLYSVTTEDTRPCFDSLVFANPDFRLIGAINTVNNLAARWSDDGTCSGAFYRTGTAVQADYDFTADAACRSLGLRWADGTMNHYGYSTAPTNWWLCG